MTREDQQTIGRTFKSQENYKNFCRHWAIITLMLDGRKSNPNWEFVMKLEGMK